MIERVLENWLDKANERSFQTPFCHVLAAQGHRVVHLSRHTAMELGKDILTVASDGVPCAYQLKGANGGKINLTKWREDIQNQMVDLTLGSVVHPSIDARVPHRSYLVVNGELEEEVVRSIEDFNLARVRQGCPERRINVIVKGDLFSMFRALETDFWPVKITDASVLLELYLDTGKGRLPKDKMASLLQSVFPFETKDGRPPSKLEASRAFAAGAVLCALGTSSFTSAENHAAEFEAWTIYFAYLLAVAEKWRLHEDVWRTEADVALRSMANALARLCDELMGRTSFLEGMTLLDPWVYNVRMTYVLSLMSLYGLWRGSAVGRDRIYLPAGTDDHDAFLRAFCDQHKDRLFIWGEHAIPQMYIYYLYFRKRDATLATDRLLIQMIEGLAARNGPGPEAPIASIYDEADDVLPVLYGVEEPETGPPGRNSPSYTLEALFQIFARNNFKVKARMMWPSVTKVAHAAFVPNTTWEYYLWRTENGINRTWFPCSMQNWPAMRESAQECEGKFVPSLMRRFPIQYLAFLCVFPHRWNSNGIRWATTQVLRR